MINNGHETCSTVSAERYLHAHEQYRRLNTNKLRQFSVRKKYTKWKKILLSKIEHLYMLDRCQVGNIEHP